METYKLIKFIGRLSEPLDCDIVAMGGTNDKSVSERLLLQWEQNSTGQYKCHMFDKQGHFYWQQSQEDERRFLDIIVDAVLLQLDEDSAGELVPGDLEQQSTLSSVTFNDSFADIGSVEDQQSHATRDGNSRGGGAGGSKHSGRAIGESGMN
jgi:hypothetical protein